MLMRKSGRIRIWKNIQMPARRPTRELERT
jgi:hypothetical protein